MAFNFGLRIAGGVTFLFCAMAAAQEAGWPAYGGDAGGQRYSRADEITPANVANLKVAWVYHTGALATRRPSRTEAAFEATPILDGRTLYLTTPFDEVIAVDAAPGTERWRFDPRVPEDFLAGVYTSRGVAPLSPLSFRKEELPGHTAADVATCMAKLAGLRNEGIYTPPSLQGSLLYPGSLGGVNWGSMAFDPETGVLYVNSNHHAFRTRLIPRWRFEADEVLRSWENWMYASGLVAGAAAVGAPQMEAGLGGRSRCCGSGWVWRVGGVAACGAAAL